MSSSNPKRFFDFAGSLADDPYQEPDAVTPSSPSHRQYQVRFLPELTVKYWLDEFPKEAQIVAVKRVAKG